MITTEDLKTVSLFADVDARLLARIASRVADIRVKKNEWIFQESDPAAFWAVIAGEVEMIKVIGGVQRQTTTFDPGEFFGEVPLMLGAATFSGCRALRDSRLLRLDANDFHNLVIESPQASAILAQTLVRRVNAIQEIFREAEVTRATIVGDRYDLACHDVRDFLYRNHIPFEWLDPNNDADRTCIAPEILASAIIPRSSSTMARHLWNQATATSPFIWVCKPNPITKSTTSQLSAVVPRDLRRRCTVAPRACVRL